VRITSLLVLTIGNFGMQVVLGSDLDNCKKIFILNVENIVKIRNLSLVILLIAFGACNGAAQEASPARKEAARKLLSFAGSEVSPVKPAVAANFLSETHDFGKDSKKEEQSVVSFAREIVDLTASDCEMGDRSAHVLCFRVKSREEVVKDLSHKMLVLELWQPDIMKSSGFNNRNLRKIRLAQFEDFLSFQSEEYLRQDLINVLQGLYDLNSKSRRMVDMKFYNGFVLNRGFKAPR
jgi:hypothetical protein